MPMRLLRLAPVALLLAAVGVTQSMAQSMPDTPISQEFPHVLASVDLQPGQSASVTVPDAYFKGSAPGEMTVYIPAGTFQDPVTFQVLAASNRRWDAHVKSGTKVVANFAYRVLDRKTGKPLQAFPSAVQYTVSDSMINSHSVYWAVKPAGGLIDANSNSNISGHVLSHPTPTAAVGWIITTPTSTLSMSRGSGSMSGASAGSGSMSGGSSGGSSTSSSGSGSSSGG